MSDTTGKNRSKLKLTAWLLFGLLLTLFFTAGKLPEYKIQSLIQGNINNALAPYGMSLSADEAKLSLLFGIKYKMKKVKLSSGGSEPPTVFDEVTLSPSLTKIALGQLAGKATIKKGTSKIILTFATKKQAFDISFDAENLDLNKLEIPAVSKYKISGIINGNGALKGDMQMMNTLNGDISLDLKSAVIQEQSLYGFKIPAINISQGQARINFKDGKGRVQKFSLGNKGNPADDISLEVKGLIDMQKQFRDSTMDVTASFTLSEKIKKTLVLADALLSPGKQADGSYAFKLAGQLTGPIYPTPLNAGN